MTDIAATSLPAGVCVPSGSSVDCFVLPESYKPQAMILLNNKIINVLFSYLQNVF